MRGKHDCRYVTGKMPGREWFKGSSTGSIHAPWHGPCGLERALVFSI